MSLSITINNINDLTDAERAVLRMIVGDKQVTLTGPTATRQFIESIAGETDSALRRIDEALDAGKSFEGAHGTFIPAPPAALAAPIPASAELDSAGLPWDKRIHASSRAKVADGTWRKMRGVDDALVATVEAELRAVQNLRVPLPSNGSTIIVDVPPGTTGITVERDPASVARAVGVIAAPVVEVVDDKAIIAVPSPDPDNRREAGEVVAHVPIPPIAVCFDPASAPDMTGYANVEYHDGVPTVIPVPVPPAPIAHIGVDPAGQDSWQAPVPPAPTATLAEMRDKLNAACATEISVEQFAAGSPGILTPPAQLTFADLMKHVTPMLISHKLSQDKLLAITAEFGLPHLSALGARPDLVEAVRARIDEVCNG